MAEGAGPWLLRDGAPPLPAELPEYVFTLNWTGTEVVGEGTVRVPNTGTTPLADVPFLLHGNDRTTATTRVTRVEGVGCATTVEADVRELLVHVTPAVPPGGWVTLRFGWTVSLQPLPPDVNDLLSQGLASLGGHGGGDFGLQATGDGITVLASGFPMLAPFVGGERAPRMVRPEAPIGDLAWNGPARWDVSLVVPPGRHVITNLADERSPDGRIRARGEGPWDFVFVGFDDAVTLTTEVGGVVVRSTARRRDVEGARTALAEAAHALRFLERYGRYPYRELDVAEASLTGGAGGVEFGGLALVAGFLYRDPSASQNPLGSLLAGLGSSPLADLGEMRAFVVAHEVAHQWSPGLLVTDAWASPVVDEALAQYLAWRVLAGGLPAPEAEALFGRQVTLGYAVMRLMGGDDGAAARETTSFPDAIAYGGLVYGKAPHLYRALEAEVGPEALDRAIARTIAARAWTVVDARSWLAALEAHGGAGAAALGDRWWYGATGDEDLALDPDGHRALQILLGPQAPAFASALAALGMTPRQYFAAFGALAR